jgi:HSP20 family molecular chaperone IbpA
MASGISSYSSKEEWGKYPHSQMETVKVRPATPLEIMDRVLSQLSTRGIGFNNHEVFFKELGNMNHPRATYPPFDILSTGEDSYEIRLALAGFSRSDLEITFQDQVLTISGEKAE